MFCIKPIIDKKPYKKAQKNGFGVLKLSITWFPKDFYAKQGVVPAFKQKLVNSSLVCIYLFLVNRISWKMEVSL